MHQSQTLRHHQNNPKYQYCTNLNHIEVEIHKKKIDVVNIANLPTILPWIVDIMIMIECVWWVTKITPFHQTQVNQLVIHQLECLKLHD